MFCFQSPFTRTSRSTVTTPTTTTTLGTQQTTKNVTTEFNRRDSEAVSEGSGSSSIQYIDQEISVSTNNSTDTLPGIRTDYLESAPLSPDPILLVTKDVTITATATPTTVTINGIQEDNITTISSSLKQQQKGNGRWRKKFLLRLKADLSNSQNNKNTNDQSCFSPLSNISTSSSSSARDSSKSSSPLITRENVDSKFIKARAFKASSTNDIPSSLNGFSEEEDDDDDVDDDDDYDDDDDDDDDDEEGIIQGEEEDDSCEETDQGSSVPSSPAAAISLAGLPPTQVPSYYSFLSVNGGAMRQETTSTSSPQLSTGVTPATNNERDLPSETAETSSVTEECLPVGMSLKKPDTLDPPSCLPAARSCPNLEQQSTGCSSTSDSSSPSPSPGPAGPRFKPLAEGDIQVCYLNHARTLVSKILSSKFLRRWETHHLYLNDACLSSKTKSIFKYQHTVSINTKEDIILKELKSMVDFALWTPLQDERVNGTPLEVVAKLLEDSSIPKLSNSKDNKIKDKEEIDKNVENLNDQRSWAEAVLGVAAPLLEKAPPPPVLARALARLTHQHPKSSLVPAIAPAITRCLKHTVDFGKSPDMRKLIQVFIAALYQNDDGEQSIRDYISSIHGPGSDCPHPRILPNLVSICVAAIFHRFETPKYDLDIGKIPPVPPLNCYLLVLTITSEYCDWRPGLSALLQPVPFPEGALANKQVQETIMTDLMCRLAQDPRCTVHRVLLPVRELRPGWIHIAAPSNPACPDDGTLFGKMLTSLLECCCRRKKFISSLLKQTGSACILLGVRGCDAAQEALCLMLEWRLLPNEEARLQVVSALQSTPLGKDRYSALCQRQKNLQELQQKGGPKKLVLPVRATDADVALLLGGGALGNLECLSLAFTSVTSACAEQLIKLPALRYLNLWATQFGDAGLQMISEHLQKLQVLNLCETPVSDKGISTLASLTSLRKLNLNSTKLSAQTFESLKKRLPSLQEFDVRYTEAW
ncbi:C-Maf-inducing protein isoform X2 [Cotesia typhae]|uniref:C-Maf-inducing protein isoform X2 n=1 Tax=Cotesia typhae TaxID=2053667 RepID=UPI003D6976C1